jgi:hypothetical protein
MKKISKIVSVAAVLGCAVIEAALAQSSEEASYQQWVEYRDEQISVAFDQIPVLVALHAIRQKTGFQFNLPSSADSKLLNLRLERSPWSLPSILFFLPSGLETLRSSTTSVGVLAALLCWEDSWTRLRACPPIPLRLPIQLLNL